MKILFVCTGNTCRSPLAEAIARREVIERGWLDVEVESAGTAANPGSPASDGSMLVGLEHGLDLGGHEARQVTPELVRSADLVLVMGGAHLVALRSLGVPDRGELLTAFAEGVDQGRGVADPFGGDLADYRTTYDELQRLIAAAFRRLAAARPSRAP